MCELTDIESPSIYQETERKARKPHVCYECGSQIFPGERYTVSKGLWEGVFEEYKRCLICQQLASKYTGCYCFGDLWVTAGEGLEEQLSKEKA